MFISFRPKRQSIDLLMKLPMFPFWIVLLVYCRLLEATVVLSSVVVLVVASNIIHTVLINNYLQMTLHT